MKKIDLQNLNEFRDLNWRVSQLGPEDRLAAERLLMATRWMLASASFLVIATALCSISWLFGLFALTGIALTAWLCIPGSRAVTPGFAHAIARIATVLTVIALSVIPLVLNGLSFGTVQVTEGLIGFTIADAWLMYHVLSSMLRLLQEQPPRPRRPLKVPALNQLALNRNTTGIWY
jgi:uncharacterized membrane protein